MEAYSLHNLSQIAQSEAGQENINLCESKIYETIEYAKSHKKKCVCFVTGVPGAGKTLVGLDVVAKSLDEDADSLSVYLSGNGPLVKVLREALKKSVEATDKEREALWKRAKKSAGKIFDESKPEKLFNKHTQAAINTLIQSSYAFKKDNALHSNPTPENILKLLFSIMDRHKDWAVMICLVGLGQDIYDGEVGINEWFRCGIEEFKEWELFYSPSIFSQVEDKNIDQDLILSCERSHQVPELHLKTSIRFFRADKQCQFVDSLLDNAPKRATEVYQQIAEKYPVYITRNFEQVKKWVRSQVRGSQRSGVLACSNAQRLKPEGIYVPTEIGVKNWFLAPSNDLRSSNMLEIVASECKVQGLELDWAIVCWDADLRRSQDGKGWDHYSFIGTRWNKRNKPEQKRDLVNSYRVLLTRARQGMVLFVPKGVAPEEDATRDCSYYDAIYNYLISCGIKIL